MYNNIPYTPKPSWNKRKLVGQNFPSNLREYGQFEQGLTWQIIYLN